MSDNPLQPLGDEQVEEVAGGYLYCEGRGTGDIHWQVLDRNGDVVKSFESYYVAENWASENGYTNNEINSKELEKLRTTGWPW